MQFEFLLEIAIKLTSSIIIVYIICYALLSAIEAILDMFGGN